MPHLEISEQELLGIVYENSDTQEPSPKLKELCDKAKERVQSQMGDQTDGPAQPEIRRKLAVGYAVDGFRHLLKGRQLFDTREGTQIVRTAIEKVLGQ